jgi:hypothetical protein
MANRLQEIKVSHSRYCDCTPYQGSKGEVCWLIARVEELERGIEEYWTREARDAALDRAAEVAQRGGDYGRDLPPCNCGACDCCVIAAAIRKLKETNG